MKTAEQRLPEIEIQAILRAADEIIMQGGRTLLAKILKGSREKKVLTLNLDTCPSYGYFKSEKMDNVMKKIDWMIDYDFLDIEYNGKLPMIVFSERGWEIERYHRADEFLAEWDDWINMGKPAPDMTYLKDRNRKMILLFLRKVRETGNTTYIPYLRAWEKNEYKKVRAAIQETIDSLESGEPAGESYFKGRQASLDDAMKGDEPADLRLKCWECGERFVFTVGEQRFYKQKGFDYPKRCEKCREKGKTWGVIGPF